MNICQFCGWEVSKPDWYNYHNGKLICDNCLMDSATEREKESAV
jgi:formylmethanofuran dehydrogenase subunit E